MIYVYVARAYVVLVRLHPDELDKNYHYHTKGYYRLQQEAAASEGKDFVT
jgi:hypothetical protein